MTENTVILAHARICWGKAVIPAFKVSCHSRVGGNLVKGALPNRCPNRSGMTENTVILAKARIFLRCFPFSVILSGACPPKNPEITDAHGFFGRWNSLRMTRQPSVIPAEAGISSRGALPNRCPNRSGMTP